MDRCDRNPLRGCSRVSEGCRNCYAERDALRWSGPGQPFEGLAVLRDGRVGKKAAGALLDGREYKQFPEEENS